MVEQPEPQAQEDLIERAAAERSRGGHRLVVRAAGDEESPAGARLEIEPAPAPVRHAFEVAARAHAAPGAGARRGSGARNGRRSTRAARAGRARAAARRAALRHRARGRRCAPGGPPDRCAGGSRSRPDACGSAPAPGRSPRVRARASRWPPRSTPRRSDRAARSRGGRVGRLRSGDLVAAPLPGGAGTPPPRGAPSRVPRLVPASARTARPLAARSRCAPADCERARGPDGWHRVAPLRPSRSAPSRSTRFSLPNARPSAAESREAHSSA